MAWICVEVLQSSLLHHSGVPAFHDSGAELHRSSGSMDLVEIPEHIGNCGGLASGCQFLFISCTSVMSNLQASAVTAKGHL